MSTNDTCCTIVPYFNVTDENMAEFKSMCTQFVELTSSEELCLFYGFSFNGNTVHCREGYVNGEGVLAHLDNVGELLQKALGISELAKLEIHGPEAELAKLRDALSHLPVEWFVLEYGFRK